MSESTALLKLQQIDLALLKDASVLAGMPQQAKLKNIAAARRKVEGQITKIVGQRKDAQLELDELEGNLQHYKDVLSGCDGSNENRSGRSNAAKSSRQARS